MQVTSILHYDILCLFACWPARFFTSPRGHKAASSRWSICQSNHHPYTTPRHGSREVAAGCACPHIATWSHCHCAAHILAQWFGLISTDVNCRCWADRHLSRMFIDFPTIFHALLGKLQMSHASLHFFKPFAARPFLCAEEGVRLSPPMLRRRRRLRNLSLRGGKCSTLLGFNISPTSWHFWVDDFPLPQVGSVGSLEGISSDKNLDTRPWEGLHIPSEFRRFWVDDFPAKNRLVGYDVSSLQGRSTPVFF